MTHSLRLGQRWYFHDMVENRAKRQIGELSATAYVVRLFAGRAADRDRDHRHPGRAVDSRGPGEPGRGQSERVREQSAAARPGRPQPSVGARIFSRAAPLRRSFLPIRSPSGRLYRWSALAELTPYLENTAAYNALDLSVPLYDRSSFRVRPENASAVKIVVAGVPVPQRHPAAGFRGLRADELRRLRRLGTRSGTPLDTDGMFFINSKTTPAKITDGTVEDRDGLRKSARPAAGREPRPAARIQVRAQRLPRAGERHRLCEALDHVELQRPARLRLGERRVPLRTLQPLVHAQFARRPTAWA